MEGRLPVIEFTESIVTKELKFSARGTSVRGGKPPTNIAPGTHRRGTPKRCVCEEDQIKFT